MTRSSRSVLLTAAAMGAVFILSACSGAGPSQPASAVTGTIVATDLAFQPKELEVSLNRPQTIRLDNKGKVLHDWTIEKVAVTGVREDGSASHNMGGHGSGAGTMMPGGMMSGASQAGQFALHIAAPAGRAATIEFTPTEAGAYVFYCTIPGHREAGMEGRLVVG